MNGRDLDGVIFADMPWIVAPDENVQRAQIAFSRYWPNRVSRRGRLYAFGYDAYRLIPQLMTSETPLELPWPGTTGTLSMGPGGRIERAQEVAEVRDGLAIQLPPVRELEPFAPEPDTLIAPEDQDDAL